MSKEYQPAHNEYLLPYNLYMQTLYLVRDYDRIKNEYHDVVDSSTLSDGIRGGGVGDPTGSKAVKLEELSRRCRAVEQALITLPQEYRSGVMNNIQYKIRFPDYAHRSTWSKYRSKFVREVAKNMHWI